MVIAQQLPGVGITRKINFPIIESFYFTNDKAIIPEIKLLYMEAFTVGLSAQYVDNLKLDKYLQTIFDTGGAFVGRSSRAITACLLYAPIGFDAECPTELRQTINSDSSVYIAELMVAEKERGKGIAKELLQSFLQESVRKRISDVVIRVWAENNIALNLYQKSGFVYAAEIMQEKLKNDGFTPFTMKKLYLRKELK